MKYAIIVIWWFAGHEGNFEYEVIGAMNQRDCELRKEIYENMSHSVPKKFGYEPEVIVKAKCLAWN